MSDSNELLECSIRVYSIPLITLNNSFSSQSAVIRLQNASIIIHCIVISPIYFKRVFKIPPEGFELELNSLCNIYN